MNLAAVSIGLPGATDHGILRELAPQIEALGFRGLWLNDNPGGDSLGGLAVAAEVTTSLQLAAGVIPLDRRPASDIAARLGDLPLGRFTLGIGSGGPKGALARVAAGIDVLRPITPVLVGALGPKMRKLGAERADGLLLNWLTPATAADAMADLRRDGPTLPVPNDASASGGRAVGNGRPTRGVLYARTIVGPEALPTLQAEAARYESMGVYAANFARLGIAALEATIDGTTDLAASIARYTDVVDELVLRVITETPSLASYQRFIEAVAKA